MPASIAAMRPIHPRHGRSHYRAQLHPWLAVQPTVQRIFNPNMDVALQDAWVAGMRLEVFLRVGCWLSRL
jgi:hypothetical protein